jgi:hypothetical protein
MYTLPKHPEIRALQLAQTVSKMAVLRRLAKSAEITSSATIDLGFLVDIANKNDRFNMLDDDSVLPADLINPIHPIFHQFQANNQLQLGLQLASHFLLHDQLLDFFVPLLYGRNTTDSNSTKNYLGGPLLHASKAKQAQLRTGVRHALQCLAHHVDISFVGQTKGVWARTISTRTITPLTSTCCQIFQRKVSPRIEITEWFLKFYKDIDGYAKATRCSQYRHDFLFAITLVHEIVHAVGVMRRGDLNEPYYCRDYPGTEWGYAWENFMFGCIINPQQKTNSGTHVLMRKIWADDNTAKEYGGKEYCDVSVSWIAKWFRTDTWNIIAEKGPVAIAPPLTHFKIQVSNALGAWIVYAGDPAVQKDMAALDAHRIYYERSHPDSKKQANIIYSERTLVELQQSNVPLPQRLPNVHRPSLVDSLMSESSLVDSLVSSSRLLLSTAESPIMVYRQSSPCKIGQKRRADADADADVLPGRTKRRH